ncbi:hypothetical protein [Halothiobacillus neapolitanus]|uniref:Thioredoxin-like fold domain-containing protein n=1 Tax=Halothiobacillus neapolitanus (strain ATCC 23641 / DSM 15147 / CIP 104769 / NCIMB 8539 / c2) TaxID=555778 RepID=D0KWY9_HALNC|nr:hypothetical protein [Halothiobacillus neapolitanus]ACX97109.1 hypothetical protein Hneap_2299 [Halothiobacillus neapolitanus c2]TDN57489.1 hypothetical protein C8D83_1136 [Halothiobacillus neapolitanus]
MNMRIRLVTVNLLFASAAFSNCYAATKHASKNDFIPPGKWVVVTPGYSSKLDDVDGSFYCVPKGNQAPDPIRLAAEIASSGSTGDYRWVGECKILKYAAQAHGFSAKLACSQTSERSGIKTSGPLLVKGEYNKPNEYIVTIRDPGQPPDPAADTTNYRKISDTCTLNPRLTIVGPKTSIAQPLNPFLDVLSGLPEGTETNIPSAEPDASTPAKSETQVWPSPDEHVNWAAMQSFWERSMKLPGIDTGPADSPKHMLVYFDPNCPVCAQQWEQLIPYLDSVRIHWIPIAYFDKDSLSRAAALLTAAHPAQALLQNERAYDQKSHKGGYPIPSHIPSWALRAVQSNTREAERILGQIATPTLGFELEPGKKYYRFTGLMDATSIRTAVHELGHAPEPSHKR